MPTNKKAAQPEPTPQTSGYRPRHRFRTVTLDTIEVEEGAEPFTAVIRSHLTFGEIDAIPHPFVEGTRYVDIEEAIAPYVQAWNALAINEKTGQLTAVPPPAEAGPEAFRCVSGIEVQWLAMQLKQTTFGTAEELARREADGVALTPDEDAAKKGTAPSASTPAQNGDKS